MSKDKRPKFTVRIRNVEVLSAEINADDFIDAFEKAGRLPLESFFIDDNARTVIGISSSADFSTE